jgi:uncharacterized protein YneF (UPF0154 family)
MGVRSLARRTIFRIQRSLAGRNQPSLRVLCDNDADVHSSGITKRGTGVARNMDGRLALPPDEFSSMSAEAIANLALGILIGVLTGFFFERRATKSVQAHNAELEVELDALRSSIYSMGGRPAAPKQAATVVPEFEQAVKYYAVSTQDSSGRVQIGAIVSHFMSKGHPKDEIDAAVQRICDGGAARRNDNWLDIG